ncbi:MULTISPECIES: PucR family transcriptional regulator [Paenibacillus]|uniref:Polyketide synthase regulator n=2 Tax=Paenibacillus TaxID=44249 RepID=A0ABX2ZET3_PAEPO|nr:MULTISPECIES: PucR family transcriptional regulator [Paenibacillus]ALA41444.1 polyketide synthase regulator [Paenibacillus peoriae]APQ58672.1 polyketide synthase regulator [Paenibacillus polymyxa]MDR6777890.1 purine catabolism regulator [Paenibacillus peoriae]ODA08798.1 polyketide synthase regulator [Paenibacillus polymyxa]OME75503.1 polyketide synthase regulator [Paenibacillus peoriae]
MKIPGVTVQELMAIPVLKEAKVLSGEQGLSRVVRFIDIMEVPDLKGWVREGVLLMTTAYSIRHEPEVLCQIIQLLHQGGAAALVIKPTRFLTEIPHSALEESNACGLPVIEIPADIPYTDITQRVMDMVLNRQAELLRRSEEIYRTLTTMVLENSGIQAVSDNIAELFKAPVALVDNGGQAIVTSPQDWDWAKVQDARHFPISVDKRTVAKLVIARNELDDMEQVGIEQARLVMALELMREKAVEDTESRLRGNFIDELMTPPLPVRHEVERRGRQLGFNPEYNWEVAVLESATAPPEEILSGLLSIESTRRRVVSHIEFRSNRAILFLPTLQPNDHQNAPGSDQETSWSDTLKNWSTEKAWGTADYYLGIGSAKKLWELLQSYNEARRAITVAQRLYPDKRVCKYSDIEMHYMLGEAMDKEEFSNLFERKLGRLQQYDRSHGSDLLKTLFYYLENRGSLVDTANYLFIHRNSVKYRLERIRDMTDFDLNDPREQFICHTCLIHYYLREHR